MRRGEVLGLKWEDVDFERQRILICRSITVGQVTTPKSGRMRSIAMAPSLGELLIDLLAKRHREAVANGWPEVPSWVFCSEAGGPLDAANLERTWRRVRRRAQKLGVRPLKLHATRHTWASWALAAGKSVRWVADQLEGMPIRHSPCGSTPMLSVRKKQTCRSLIFQPLDGTRRHQTSMGVMRRKMLSI